MKMITVLMLILFSTMALADRGPYFPNPEKAPIKHGKIIFNSPDLTQINGTIYIGNVVIQNNNGLFEVGPMIYNCTFNDDDGAYGSLGCKYVRYEFKKTKSYKDCEILNDESFYCE